MNRNILVCVIKYILYEFLPKKQNDTERIEQIRTGRYATEWSSKQQNETERTREKGTSFM